MLISDWSSDVCSSDLRREIIFARQVERPHRFGNEAGIADRDRRVRAGAEGKGGRQRVEIRTADIARDAGAEEQAVGGPEHQVEARQQEIIRTFGDGLRSEESREGKEGGITCRIWWFPYHTKN